MIKKLFTFLLLLTIGLGARADYSVKSIDGYVRLLKHGQITTLSPGMKLDPNDQVKIHNGSTLKIFSSTDSKIYTLTTPGIEKVARLIFQARREARSNATAVNKQMKLTRNADNEGVVFVEKGKVTRSLAVYDPEGQNLQMDAGKLAESLLVHLRDSLGTASAAEEIALTRRIDPDGLSFMVENVLDHPIYFNVFKISSTDGSVTISELGQPVGCYAILPTQFLAREQTTGLNSQELHLLLFTDFYFDIDEVLSKLNALLDAKTEVNAPEGVQLYVMPV